MCMCRDAATELPHAVLPMMRSFTFLRLTPEMLDPEYQGAWLRFMHGMRTIASVPKGGVSQGTGSAPGENVKASMTTRGEDDVDGQEPGTHRAGSS